MRYIDSVILMKFHDDILIKVGLKVERIINFNRGVSYSIKKIISHSNRE